MAHIIPRVLMEITLVIILLMILLWGMDVQQEVLVENHRDDVIRQTYEAEYGPVDSWNH